MNCFCENSKKLQANLAAKMAVFDLRLPALFLWIMPRLASLSIMACNFGISLVAVSFSVSDLNFFKTVRMLFA